MIILNCLVLIVETLIYKWAPLLIEHDPKDAVDMLVSKPKLKPHFLLPALLRYCDVNDREVQRLQERFNLSKKKFKYPTVASHYAIQYLENYFTTAHGGSNDGGSFIRTPVDASIYHCYCWMLCKYDDPDEGKLIAALQLDCDPINDILPIAIGEMHPIDYSFILRQCQLFKRKKSSLLCSIILGLIDEALTSALVLDLELAKVSNYIPRFICVIHSVGNRNPAFSGLCSQRTLVKNCDFLAGN
jgi:hypothetical protein